jgi:hypothetical protein
MLREISFSRETRFQGRNGYFRCKGLAVGRAPTVTSGGEVIFCEPVTSRGEVGNCQIQVPVEAVPELIGVLRELQNEADDNGVWSESASSNGTPSSKGD